jgi:hypothetical protein
MDKDDGLNNLEFIVAMHLIHLKLSGIELPNHVPNVLLDITQKFLQTKVMNPIPAKYVVLPDPLPDVPIGIDTQYDLTLFEDKLDPEPFLHTETIISQCEPWPHEKLVEDFKIAKTLTKEDDLAADIENVNSKVTTLAAATSIFKSSEPVIKKIFDRIENENSLRLELTREIDSLTQQKALLLSLYTSIAPSLKENQDKISQLELEAKEYKSSISTTIDEIISVVDNDLATEHGAILQQIQSYTNAIMEQRNIKATHLAEQANLMAELQRIKDGKDSDQEESDTEEEVPEKKPQKNKSLESAKKKKTDSKKVRTKEKKKT